MLTNDALDADDACLLPAVLVLPGTGDADADGARCNVDGTRIENVRHAPGTGRGGDFTCVRAATIGRCASRSISCGALMARAHPLVAKGRTRARINT